MVEQATMFYAIASYSRYITIVPFTFCTDRTLWLAWIVKQFEFYNNGQKLQSTVHEFLENWSYDSHQIVSIFTFSRVLQEQNWNMIVESWATFDNGLLKYFPYFYKIIWLEKVSKNYPPTTQIFSI